MSVRLSIKSFFDFNEILYVGRGRRVMHDGMQYDPIQGQRQGHEPLKVGHFQRLSPPPFIMGAGKWPRILKVGGGQYLKLIRAGILIFVLVFVSRDFEVGSK